MFSFTKIATIAALAFSTLASALPSPIASPEVNALAARAGSPDVTTALTTLQNNLQGPVGQLNALTPATATPANVHPIIIDIQVIIEAGLADCKGKHAGSGDILVLLSIVINLVIGACGKVCGYPGVDFVSLQAIVVILDVSLSALISLVLGLVGGLLTIVIALLVGLLGTVVSILGTLKFTLCLKALLIL